jgi:hypothetical protein
MRVCDHCGARAISKVTFEDDHQEFDLCLSMKEKLLEIIGTKEPDQAEKKKPGRPTKDKE